MKYIFRCFYIVMLLRFISLSNSDESEKTFEDVIEFPKKAIPIKHPEYHFGYRSGPKGPGFWRTLYPTCGGLKQSPIDINLALATEVKIEKLRWKNYHILPLEMIAINNGHSVSLTAVLPKNTYASIEGGPLTEAYTFESLHFHWGTENNLGSEHSLNKKLYPMEMHCIHKKKRLPFDAAAVTHDGLVVIAYFFELSSKENPALNSILEEYTQLMVDLNIPINLQNTFKLHDLIIPFKKEYITYQGSLTTPPCSEVVIWIISPYPAYISEKQLSKFRKISQASGMDNNFRPAQPIGNRTIYLVT